MSRAAVLSPALSKEVRALLPLWVASIAALVAALVWRDAPRYLLPGPRVALFVYVVGSLAIGAQSVGQEYTYRTLPMLLSQPADRRRVYLLKFVVAAVMLLTLAAFAAATFAQMWRPDSARVAVVILPMLCGLFVAPVLTMVCRSTLAGMVFGPTAMAMTWLATLAIAWFGFGIDSAAADQVLLGRWTIAMILVCPVVGLFGWRRFRELEATDVASAALHLPRWLTRAHRAPRHRPLRALAGKEVHLQQMVFAISGVYIIAWTILVLLQRYVPSMATFPVAAVLLLYCLGLAIVIGALASAEERQHGTLDWQLLQPSPAWQQWMVKVCVSFGLALLFGVGLPVLLNQLTSVEGFHTIRPAGLTMLIILLTATSMYISSLSGSGVRAMVLSLPVGLAVAYFVQVVIGSLRWLMSAGTASWVDIADVGILAARVFTVTLAPVLLWFGFVNHRSSEPGARRVTQQIAWIALLLVTGLILAGALY